MQADESVIWIAVGVLVNLWLMALLFDATFGGFVHLLFLAALVLGIVELVRELRRRVVIRRS
jgi:nitrate/nitrite transporter NarK